MKIYLVRHGESTEQGNDDERPLSQKGKEDILRLTHFISPLKIQVSKTMQSNKCRAQQTAEILLTAIQSSSIQTRQELEPLADCNPIIAHLYAEQKDVLVVGHMPFMGRLVGKLITGNADEDVVAFKTGSMVCLELKEYRWVISWLLNPDLFNPY